MLKFKFIQFTKHFANPFDANQNKPFGNFFKMIDELRFHRCPTGEDARVRDIGDDIKIERPFWKLPNSNLSPPRVVCVLSKGKVTSVTRWQPPKKEVWARHSKKNDWGSNRDHPDHDEN